MNTNSRLIVAHSIMDDRIREAREARMLRDRDHEGVERPHALTGVATRMLEAVKNVSISFPGLGTRHAAGALSR